MSLPTRIMVFGTFDILHPGHLNFFKQARALTKNSLLIVSVARDSNVKKIKGQLSLHSEAKRLKAVGACPLVDLAVMGSKKNYLDHIIKASPQIIALGYDQAAYVEALRHDIKTKKLKIKIRRLKPYRANKFKSSLLKK